MRLTGRSGKQGVFAISTRAWYMFYMIQEIWILSDNLDKFRFEIVPNDTVTGTISRNKMDTHTDTCSAIADWQLLDFTNKVCKVTTFLDLYVPVKEVMVARCGTVWTSPNTGHEYLLVGDQMLWFERQMDH
jgi:hypothetical protein